MNELVKWIDPHFAYEWHEIEDSIMMVYVRSTRKDAQCPYYGSTSKQVHSIYPRRFRNLPIHIMKVEVIIRSHKFYLGRISHLSLMRAEMSTPEILQGKINLQKLTTFLNRR